MPFCGNCGSEGIETEDCRRRGSCRMHRFEDLQRAREDARQRGEMHSSDMNQVELNKRIRFDL